MTTPTLLATPKIKADEAIVRDLKECLAQAESGEIEDICVVAWKRSGGCTIYGIVNDVTRRIGALTRMIHDLLQP